MLSSAGGNRDNSVNPESEELTRRNKSSSSMTEKMDLSATIEEMETGDQDSALTALQSYNEQVNLSPAAERDPLCISCLSLSCTVLSKCLL